MGNFTADRAFGRAQHLLYVDTVARAAAETYQLPSWRPEDEVYNVLADALGRRGIEPDYEAVRAGAAADPETVAA